MANACVGRVGSVTSSLWLPVPTASNGASGATATVTSAGVRGGLVRCTTRATVPSDGAGQEIALFVAVGVQPGLAPGGRTASPLSV